MPGEDLILSDANRAKLDGIVQQMTQNNEPDDAIMAVVGDFKSKYGEKKNGQNVPSPLLSPSSGSASGSTAGASVPTGINYLAGENFTGPAPAVPNIPEIPDSSPLMAASTPAATVPKDQSQFDPNIQQKSSGLLTGEKTESFMRGAARLAGSVLKTPGFLYDVTTAVTNKVINEPFGLPYTPTAKQIGDAVPDDLNVVKDLDQAVSSSQEVFQKKYDKGISEYFKNGEYGKGFDLLANSIVETAPTTIALMLGNAAGVTAGQSVFAGGAVFGADKMSQLEKENPNISQEQKVMVAAANGLLEGAFEQFGLTKLGAVAKETLKKAGKEAAMKIAEDGFKASYGKVLKQYLGVAAEEPLSEAATQFAQNTVDKYSGANPDLDLREGVVDAALIGLGAGASFGSPTTVLSAVRTKKALKQAAKLADEKKALEEDLQMPEVPDEVKASISKKIKNINEQEADLASQEKEKFNNLTPEGQQQVEQLLQKSNEISSVITNENVSDETRESFKKDLDAIDNEIDKVYETAVKPKEAEEPAQEPAGEDTEAEIAYLTELKNTFGLEEPELARLVELQSGRPQQAAVAEVQPEVEAVRQEPVEQEAPQQDEIEQPAQESPGPQTINTEQNGQETKTETGEETDVLTPEEQPAEQAIKQEPPPAATPSLPQNELVDEEEDQDTVKDSPAAKEALDKDIEAMKQMKTEDLAEKKFIGMVERAWKAKEDGKISRSTYTAFRNKAKDILEGKVRTKDGLDATEAKLKSSAAMNKVKANLAAQGYKTSALKQSENIDESDESTSDSREAINKLSSLKEAPNEEVFDYLISINKDKLIAPVLKAMIENADRIPKRSFKGVRNTFQWSGKYYYYDGGIQISKNLDQFNQKFIVEVATHEFVHAFTSSALTSNRKTKRESEFFNEIKSIYDEFKNSTKYTSEYGLTNEEEFVAEIMTNNDFVEKMSSSTPTLFEKFIKAVLKLFGFNDVAITKNEKLVKKARQIILDFIPDADPFLEHAYGSSSKPFEGAEGIKEILNRTQSLIKRGIDAGYSLEEATSKAMNIVKLHPSYKKVVGENKTLNEKSFEQAVIEGLKPKPKKNTATQDNADQPAEISGSKKKKKTIGRLEASEKFKKIAEEIREDDKFYTSIKIPAARKYINERLDAYQREGLLEDLAREMIDGGGEFHPKIAPMAAAKLSDRLRVIAEREGNEMQRSAINKLAAKLWATRTSVVNVAATITGLEQEVAKDLPLSEEGLQDVVNASIGNIQDTYFNDVNKSDTEAAAKSFQEIMESEAAQKAIREAVDAEINRIAEATKGKEWVQAVDVALDGLKIDLTDC